MFNSICRETHELLQMYKMFAKESFLHNIHPTLVRFIALAELLKVISTQRWMCNVGVV